MSAADNTEDSSILHLTRAIMNNTEDDSYRSLHSPDVEKESTMSPRDPLLFHGFWDKDPESTQDRLRYFTIVSSGFLLILILIIWCILPIYWGSVWKTPQHVHNLNGWLVDLDGGVIGQFVTKTFLATNGPPTSMTWSIPSHVTSLKQSSNFEHAVVDEQAWAVISINANASSNLNHAIASSDASYNGSLAVTAWTNEARNQNAYRIISPQIMAIMQYLDQNFAAQHAAQSSSSTNVTSLLSSAPQTVTSPLGYTMVNTRPFDVQIVTAVNFVGMIYLTILAFVAVMIHYGAIMDATRLYRRLMFSHLILLRLLVLFVGFFVLSAFYALLSLAFKAPFTRWFGASGFVIYWMMAWLAMMALGFALQSVVILLTPRFIPFFLTLWIVVNISPSAYPIELLPGIFRYGYAMPFYNLSKTVLTICFNTKNRMGLNFGVQMAWIAISVGATIAFELLVRTRNERAWKKQYEEEKEKYSIQHAAAPSER